MKILFKHYLIAVPLIALFRAISRLSQSRQEKAMGIIPVSSIRWQKRAMAVFKWSVN